MKKHVSKLGVAVLIGIVLSGCENPYSSSKHPQLYFDTGRVTKVDMKNDIVFLDTNRRKGADISISGAFTKDSSLVLKKGDRIFYGYDSLKRVDTVEKLPTNKR